MAEKAPITSAHAHARKAAKETGQASWTKAAVEHQHAASNFAKSARATSDGEALRVLKLLEEQHLRLARIIRTEDEARAARVANGEQDKSHDTSTAATSELEMPLTDAKPDKNSNTSSSTLSKPTTSALAAARAVRAPRDSSPALAKDIASRRGIPAPGRTQPSPAAQARTRPLSPESRRRDRSSASSPSTQPKIPPSIVDSQAELKKVRANKKTEDDDAFGKFYNSITTGTMSKLSSAMAFAGMPLTQQDNPSSSSKDQPSPNKRTVSATNEPDVTKIFSKAALDAVEAEHRRKRGNRGHFFGPAESFYVVQKGGGSYSYADITRPHQPPLSEIGEQGDEDAFVDAREVPHPASSSSPRHSRSSSSAGGPQRRGTFGKGQTIEELELENATLKQTLEHLAGRLAAFEAHAQDASMAALTQSMAGLRPVAADQKRQQQHHQYQAASPPPRSESAEAAAAEDGGGEGQMRIRALEDEREKLAAKSAKQEKKLQRYEAKWLELQKGAREKRERARKGAEEGGEGETTG